MKNFRKIGASAILMLGIGFVGLDRVPGGAQPVLPIPRMGQNLTADGGAPPPPPIPFPKNESPLTADGGAPPPPPIPFSKDGGAPPPPPIPWVNA